MKLLLDPETGHFHAFMREWLPGQSIRFGKEQIHVIGRERAEPPRVVSPWGGLVPEQEPQSRWVELDDIATDEDNAAAADTLFQVMRRLKAVPGTMLHASVAGGRKSMGFYMGHAFSLLSDPGDTLSHVLVNEPFESSGLDFYYPPRTPRSFNWADADGQLRERSTAEAELRLAELSVLRLGPALAEFPIGENTSFAEAVKLAQAVLVPVPLKIRLDLAEGRGEVSLCGRPVRLPRQQLLVLSIYAWARRHEEQLPEGGTVAMTEFEPEAWEALWETLSGSTGDEDAPSSGRSRSSVPRTPEQLRSLHSRIKDALTAAVGPAARHYQIQRVGAKAAPGTAARLGPLAAGAGEPPAAAHQPDAGVARKAGAPAGGGAGAAGARGSAGGGPQLAALDGMEALLLAPAAGDGARRLHWALALAWPVAAPGQERHDGAGRLRAGRGLKRR
ncbi:CRISPR-associated ring nuclease Csm6 [Caldimonas tepidiphila]|uniref:CRISPR-associated ring nuclease Csm6 n=1 Tax=Caldimonas tepidiphila TaxID=2315841 RepID=UPI001473AB9A|nr:CRISPR-associated ring nuclease Csm6 [Caldimonas tepidiphila]